MQTDWNPLVTIETWSVWVVDRPCMYLMVYVWWRKQLSPVPWDSCGLPHSEVLTPPCLHFVALQLVVRKNRWITWQTTAIWGLIAQCADKKQSLWFSICASIEIHTPWVVCDPCSAHAFLCSAVLGGPVFATSAFQPWLSWKWKCNKHMMQLKGWWGWSPKMGSRSIPTPWSSKFLTLDCMQK